VIPVMAVKRRALAERRKAVGSTQEQLAEVLDVERSTVVRWEAGETTPLPKLAEALAVSVDELDAMLAERTDSRERTITGWLRAAGRRRAAQVGGGGRAARRS